MFSQVSHLIKVTPAVLSVSLSLLAMSSVNATPDTDIESAIKESLQPSDIKALPTPTVSEYAHPDAALGVLRNRPKLKIPGAAAVPETEVMPQVTNVSELRDVEATTWAYEALRSLVERYGCIIGYPDRSFRGNRALTRWEFAAGLNACLNTMERLIQENVTVLREDIEKLKRLAEEFKQELTALGTRIDNLESRVTFLEDHQFSTTTKLTGEVVAAVSGIAGGEKNAGTENVPQVPVLGYRARLELNTSFTGKDLLYTRLATGNFPEFVKVAGTDQSNFAFAQPDDSVLALEVLNYNFPIAEGITLWLEATGGAFDDFTDTVSVLDGDGAEGALSVFGTRNLVYYQGFGSGLALAGEIGGFDWGELGWSVGYLAPEAANPNASKGLFNGAYAILAQLQYATPDDKFTLAFTFNNGYNTLNTGSNTRQLRPIVELADSLVDTSHNTYALTTSWQINDNFVFGAWGGIFKASTLNSFALESGETFSRGKTTFWYWAVSLAFPDTFAEGNTAGIIFGMLPLATENTILVNGIPIEDDDASFHLEAFYQYALSDNILLTPGIIVVTSPDNDSRNSALIIGVIRTTFTF